MDGPDSSLLWNACGPGLGRVGARSGPEALQGWLLSERRDLGEVAAQKGMPKDLPRARHVRELRVRAHTHTHACVHACVRAGRGTSGVGL